VIRHCSKRQPAISPHFQILIQPLSRASIWSFRIRPRRPYLTQRPAHLDMVLLTDIGPNRCLTLPPLTLKSSCSSDPSTLHLPSLPLQTGSFSPPRHNSATAPCNSGDDDYGHHGAHDEIYRFGAVHGVQRIPVLVSILRTSRRYYNDPIARDPM
jgi:hypothetical protein